MAATGATTRRQGVLRLLDRLSPSRLAVPTFVAAWSFLVLAPLVVIVLFSFLQVRSYRIVYEPTLATWQSLVESGRWISAVRTLRVAITMTIIEFALAFPFALWMAKGCKSKRVKALLITLLTIPVLSRRVVPHHRLALDPRHQRHHQHGADVARHRS